MQLFSESLKLVYYLRMGKKIEAKRKRESERRQAIIDLRASGKTYSQVAAHFRITRGRAWQIVRGWQ